MKNDVVTGLSEKAWKSIDIHKKKYFEEIEVGAKAEQLLKNLSPF